MTIFHHEGFETRCAGTVAEALAALITRPDFIVLDLHLPDGRGTQVLREIRERNILAKVAVTTGTIDASRSSAPPIGSNPTSSSKSPTAPSTWSPGSDRPHLSHPSPTTTPRRVLSIYRAGPFPLLSRFLCALRVSRVRLANLLYPPHLEPQPGLPIIPSYNMTSQQIRQQFIDFFVKKHGHTFVPVLAGRAAR